MLTLAAPNVRGDDVSELQAALARLGFDCGRVDGIFGPATLRALEDFQRNCGLYDDGVCGPDTVKALHVLARQTGSGPGVAVIRELEQLTAGARELADLRVLVGQFGGLSALARQLVQALRHRSATVNASDEPDASAQASAANRFAAHVYVGFEAGADPATTVHFYQVPQFESAGGRRLAEAIHARCSERTPLLVPEIAGMRLPVLRETRMPAVLITIGQVQEALDHSGELVAAIVGAIAAWASGHATTPSP